MWIEFQNKCRGYFQKVQHTCQQIIWYKPSVIYFLLSKCTYCFSENDNLFSLVFLSFCTSAIERFYYWLVQLSSVQYTLDNTRVEGVQFTPIQNYFTLPVELKTDAISFCTVLWQKTHIPSQMTVDEVTLTNLVICWGFMNILLPRTDLHAPKVLTSMHTFLSLKAHLLKLRFYGSII